MKIPFIQVDPTTRCNYTCGFCAGRHMAQGDIDLASFGRLLGEVEGVEHIELQGEGEPLLHPQFFGLVAASRRRFPGVGISMISNGSLFTSGNIPRILDSDLSRIFVSMESADDDRFQAIRGGKLDRVRRGVLALLEARLARGLARPTIGIAVTLLRSTVDELVDRIAPLYRELGLDGGITVQPLQGMPQYANDYAPDMRAEMPGPADAARFEARLRDAPDVQRILAERQRQPGFYELLYGATAGRPVCPWLENGLYVTQDGCYVPCCHVKDAARHGMGRIGDDLSQVAARRAGLASRLAAGQVPPSCTGCRLAHRIAAFQAGQRGRRPG